MSATNIGGAKGQQTSTFTTALSVNAVVFAVQIGIYTVLRPRFPSIYEPRTYAGRKRKRVESIGHKLWAWPMAVYNSDYRDIIRVNGLDSYFFVRFLRMMVRILLPVWFVTWASLLPLTSVAIDPTQDGLDRFTYGNVTYGGASTNKRKLRYIGHVLCAYSLVVWVIYNIRKEMRHFVVTRQDHLIEPVHAASVRASTVLITGIPARYLSEKEIINLYSHLPGGVKKVWINRDLKDLPDLYERRLSACNKLESAETALISSAVKSIAKNGDDSRSDRRLTTDAERNATLADQLVPRQNRPTHRLPILFLPFSLPFIGKKVDTIDWCREEIRHCTEQLARERQIIAGEEQVDEEPTPGAAEVRNEEIQATEEPHSKKAQEAHDQPKDRLTSKDAPANDAQKYPPLNSAFILFEKQIAAHMCMQLLAHHEPYRISKKYIELSPNDVVWENLGLNPYEQKVRQAISYFLTLGLIVLWSIPVGFVGVLSNVNYLCSEYPFLAWLCDLPEGLRSVISGILPPVFLAILMAVLPIILRYLAQFEGIPKKTGLELSLMSRFFIFQVLHSFLIVTLSSGLVAFIRDGWDTITVDKVPNLLATELPKASNFFLTYIILQGLTGAAGGFLQIVPFILYYVQLFILGSSPRSIYDIKYGLRTVAWGTLFPNMSLLVVITFGYSLISPIINGLACFTFWAFYMLYKYLFLWQYEEKLDTGGLFFPKAMNHIFVGLYIQQICLAALFFLATGTTGFACGVCMIVLIAITAFYQAVMNNSFRPLINPLPLTMADKTWGVAEHSFDTNIKGREPGIGGTANNHPDDQRPGPSTIPNSNTETQQDARPPSLLKQLHTAEQVYGFTHPAVSRPQRTIWLPNDPLGLAREEEIDNERAGVEASCDHAEMNEQGKVDVFGLPPDVIAEDDN